MGGNFARVSKARILHMETKSVCKYRLIVIDIVPAMLRNSDKMTSFSDIVKSEMSSHHIRTLFHFSEHLFSCFSVCGSFKFTCNIKLIFTRPDDSLVYTALEKIKRPLH